MLGGVPQRRMTVGRTDRVRSAAPARLTVLVLLAAAATATLAAVPAAARGRAHFPTPALGDWEGIGPDGVPLSFALAPRAGGVSLNALAVGFPGACPVGPRHTLAVPVDHLRYLVTPSRAHPGAIVLSGTSGAGQLNLRGQLATARSATLSTVAENQQLPCAWPRTLTWRVHPAHRVAIADATWRATVTTPGVSGTVVVRTAAGGRVVTSFQASYICGDPAGDSGHGVVGSTPAGEFIAPSGSFSSPADLQSDRGVSVRWSGVFAAGGALRGSFTDASPCTDRATQVSFAAARPLRSG